MHKQTLLERRKISEQESSKIFNLIHQYYYESVRVGIQPTEVWLGPKEARILEVEMNWQSAEGRLVHTNENQSVMILGNMEGAKLMGLRVRLMVKDGIRVGTSFPNPPKDKSSL